MGQFTKLTFFVEDKAHRTIITCLAAALGMEIATSECGNSANVRSLYRFSKADGGWQNSYFIHDSDNEGNPFKGEERFIHLDKYSIENYLFDTDIIAAMTGKTEAEIRAIVLQCIKENQNKILKKNQFLGFLLDGMTADQITPERLAKLDCSQIIEAFVSKLGYTMPNFIQVYTDQVKNRGQLDNLFPKEIVQAIRSSAKPSLQTANDLAEASAR
jgi:hypothetical protein